MPADDRTVAFDRPEPRADQAQRRLADRYVLLERIDAGGAGEVWRARDTRLDRDVAVKILGADADEAFRDRFADEARRAASVVHPNVVTVFDEGRDGDDSFMVMEYVRGRTLRDMVAERGPLPAHEAARLVAQVAAALDAAHEAGVIHCDVKPANVIVDDNGTAKLADFGIARAARGPREHELIGTARYIAPERVAGEPATERSDIYSLGLVAYELLAGRPAYAELDTEDLLRERLDGPAPSLRGARVGVSDAVDRVVRRALARDPDDRYARAGYFARDLLSATERGDATGVLAPPAPRPLRRGRSWGIDTTVALLGIVGILLATLIVFASFQGERGAPAPTAAGRTPAPAGAPNVVGKSLQDGIDQMLAAGIGLVRYDVDSGARGQPCTVTRQEPAAGAGFTRGSTATLWYIAGKNCAKGKDD
ncbi:MAG TPA: serine/threonine-protein kinase [Candidatus Limnocylindria bacterium]|nr:serine/threonine-protein kinase [Candidatus Limnocylindria bacterium]